MTVVDLSGGGGDSYTAATMSDFIQGLTTESAPSTSDYLMLDDGSAVKKVTLEDIGDLIGSGSSIDLGDIDENIIPDDDNTRILGASSFRWATLWVHDVSVKDELEIDGTLNHDGNRVGFYGVAPVVQETWSNATSPFTSIPTKVRNAANTIAEVAFSVNAIIDRLDELGLLELE